MAESYIRTFNEKDWHEVSRIYRQGLNTNLATFQTACPTYEEWDKKHLDKCRYVSVGEDKIQGWLALMPFSAEPVYSGVAEVSIYIENRSKHRGIGTSLLMEAVHQAKDAGIWTLQATIMHNNYSCILLFQKCGFRKVGFRNKIARDRFGTWRKIVLMEKRSGSDQFDCRCD